MKKILCLVVMLVLVASVVYAATVTLTWTAPADDKGKPTEGAVTAYKLVYLQVPITTENFESGTVIVTSTPKVPGQTETLTLDLPSNEHYYFAIKSVDGHNNWSELSNVVQRDFLAPAAIIDLQ